MARGLSDLELLGDFESPGAAGKETAVHGAGVAGRAGSERGLLIGEIDDAEADRAMAEEARTQHFGL